MTTTLTKNQLLAMPEADYMNEAQLAFFKELLTQEREEALQSIQAAHATLHAADRVADISDWATTEEERQKGLRNLERNQGRLCKVDNALARVADGEYGWCEDSGLPIGLKRLLVRPTATLCIEVKEAREAQEQHIAKRRGAA